VNLGWYLFPRLRGDYRQASQYQLDVPDPLNEVEARQFTQIQRIWSDCSRNVPYYAKLVANGRAPEVLRTWKDFHQIPPLTRQAIQEQPALFLRAFSPDHWVSTGGSTGNPVRIGISRVERALTRVIKVATWQRHGYIAESKLFLIWGHSHLLGTGLRGRINHLKRKVADSLFGYARVDAYRLSPERCHQYAAKLLRVRPCGIIGYASALDLFARNTSEFHERFRRLRLKFVLATSESAPRPDTFKLLSQHFGCPVIQEYGGAEFGQVAVHHGSDEFEVLSTLNYVECAREQDSETGGQPILVTPLYDRYLPLFRYQTGDAIAEPTTLQNRSVVAFKQLLGRANDMVRISEGESVHSVAILHCIHQEPSVFNIQMAVQDEGVVVRLVTSGRDDKGVEQRVLGRLAQVSPALGHARINFVSDVATSTAGKRRWWVDERSTRPEARN
jgi:phenylacetate-CoA ligase